MKKRKNVYLEGVTIADIEEAAEKTRMKKSTIMRDGIVKYVKKLLNRGKR